MNRLRQAREYMGFSLGEVAGYLRTDKGTVALIEDAGVVDDITVRRLSRLYQRPVGYLRGTEEAPPVPDAVMDVLDRNLLKGNDRREIMEFARFLRHAAEGPGPGKA